jgi:membrane-associated phospholipid phosphatase
MTSSAPTALPDAPGLSTSTADTADIPSADDSTQSSSSNAHSGIVSRSVRRGLEDQKNLYLAPLKPANFKWDLLMLAGTGALLAADRTIESNLSKAHFNAYQNTSDILIGGLGASLAGVWVYGIKTDNPHARETGELELEALANTFLIYTPMQIIAGRQRPGEGNGNGDFLQHHALNTSFPAGHAMFSWSMAAVAAHEYPKPWVQVLVYGTAAGITASRFLAHDHWASDSLVGTGLGFAIGTYIFHSHCDPDLSPSCHRRK